MKNTSYSRGYLFGLFAMFGAVSLLWLFLGGTVATRSVSVSHRLASKVDGNWGPSLAHTHPRAIARATRTGDSTGTLLPETSTVHATLDFKPQKKGLITHRTYTVALQATYEWVNPEPVEQTIEVNFRLPSDVTRVDGFKVTMGDKVSEEAPPDGNVHISAMLPANGKMNMTVEYGALGKDSWRYLFGEGGRTRNFELTLDTNFSDYNVPDDAESATLQRQGENGLTHVWKLASVTGVNAVGLEVPDFVNAARVASRMSFFGPLSLGLFFAVLVIAAMRMGVKLHFMHFVFLSAACFAFQLLFSYSVDVAPVALAFLLSAAVSMGLVGAYLKIVAGIAYTKVALLAQLAYIVIFNATFFLDGYTGLTLTVVGVITLGLVMTGTAQMDWSKVLRSGDEDARPQPPPPLPAY